MKEILFIIMIIVYIFFILSFIVYSYVALRHLKTYGYVGDASQLVRLIYIILSIVLGVITILAFILI